MSATATILLLWLAFAGSHMGLASNRLRPKLVERLGERGFAGVYSLVSLAFFVPLVGVYSGNKHAGLLLWDFGEVPGLRWLMYVGMGLALALAISGGAQPSPASMVPGKTEVKGVFRITRHPLFMGVGLFGLLHLFVTPVNTSELVFFAGFPIFAIAGCRHQDQRKRITLGDDYRRFCAETPFLPGSPGGILQGIGEQPIPMAIGVGLTFVLRYFHGSLFG